MMIVVHATATMLVKPMKYMTTGLLMIAWMVVPANKSMLSSLWGISAPCVLEWHLIIRHIPQVHVTAITKLVSVLGVES